ncbi:MAG: hypothetical protein JNK53_00625 [Phycisphaerae bacterium]|nr:hypothetical protein [Phycisphaerae bacterium]
MQSTRPVTPHLDLQALVSVVAAALPLTRTLAQQLERVPAIRKPDGSPVTVVDFVVQAVLVHGLRRLAPSTGFICEESRKGMLECDRPDVVRLYLDTVRPLVGAETDEHAMQLLDPAPPSADDWWLIDPIDGTSGFVAGAHFSVCVARVTGGRAVMSAVGCPRLQSRGSVDVAADGPGSVVAASRDGGAWNWCEATRAYAPLARAPWRQPLRWARSVNRRNKVLRAQPAVDSLGFAIESIPIDSQCKYALVAADRADVAVRLPGRGGPECGWDHVAGTLVAHEAGARSTDVLGKPLDARFGVRLERNSGVLCAPPELHARMVQALADVAAETPA